jgi:long-chain acyl-CoA synthetase
MFHYYCAILAGGAAVHHNGVVFSRRVYDSILEYGVTVTYLQAPALTMLLNALGDEFSSLSGQLRLLMTGGAMVSEQLKKMLTVLLPRAALYVFYGATENLWVSYYRFDTDTDRTNCVGKAAPGNNVFITDDIGDDAGQMPPRGIITVEGPGMFKEYLNEPELTASVLKNGQLLMADIGYTDADGYVYLLGRRDDVIVTGGYKVAPYEIEEVALQYGGIAECACIGTESAALGSAIKLFVLMSAGAEFSAANIAKYLGQHLETYKVPRYIVEVSEFPRMGDVPKINRKELQKWQNL